MARPTFCNGNLWTPNASKCRQFAYELCLFATPLIHRPGHVMSDQRQPLMEITDNSELSSPALASTARRSGRVIKAPEKYVPDAPVATKRKHAAEHDEEDVENESPDEDAEANGDSDAGESDAEEDDEVVKRPKTKRAPSRSTKTKKPAAKKPKINGSAPKFSNHASKHLPSRPKKNARLEIARRRGDELYGIGILLLAPESCH